MEIYYIQDKKPLFKIKGLDTTFPSLTHTYDIEKIKTSETHTILLRGRVQGQLRRIHPHLLPILDSLITMMLRESNSQ